MTGRASGPPLDRDARPAAAWNRLVFDLWTRYEPIHAVTYFAPDAADAAARAGYRGFWMGYFAQRAAPLGPVGPAVVTGSFFGFHPGRVARALPDAWAFAGPDRALAARLEGVDRSLHRIWGPELLASADVREAAELLWSAAQGADTAGRVLGAANQALPRPEPAHLALWQATSTLREHRGDGHIAALIAHDVGPVEAMTLRIAAGAADGTGLRRGRGWPDEAWTDAAAALTTRGWLDGAGVPTATGRRGLAEIDTCTEAAAASPWTAIGPDRTRRALDLLDRLVAPILAADLIPALNAIGVPRPDDRGTRS